LWQFCDAVKASRVLDTVKNLGDFSNITLGEIRWFSSSLMKVICGPTLFVTQHYLWPNTICGPTLFVAQHYLWPSTICDPALFVAQHYLWPNTICGLTLFVAQHYLWPNTICGPTLFVAQHYLWPNTICGPTLLTMHKLMLVFVVVFKYLLRQSPATLTEVFPWFFLSCKANARAYLAKTGHSPHYS